MTTLRKSTPGAAAAPLLYWLLLISGLAVLTVVRIDVLQKVVPLWAGAVIGTLLGQFLATRRVRLWLLLFVVANAMWCGAIVAAPLWMSLWSADGVWSAVELSVLSFAPAAICGYYSLSERGGLAAFWFPTVLWMLALLDGNAGATLAASHELHGATGWLFLAALAALFVGFLHAREARRVALWKAHAGSPLAGAVRRSILREAPLRRAAPAAWIAGLGAATLALTGWIAPHLWQKDKLQKREASTPATSITSAHATGPGEPCCPEPAVVDVERSRVRELFPVLSSQDGHVPTPPPIACIACVNGVPAKDGHGMAAGGGAGGASTGAPVATADGVPGSTAPQGTSYTTPGKPTSARPTAVPPTPPVVAPSVAPPPPKPAPVAEAPRPVVPPASRPRPATPAAPPPAVATVVVVSRPAVAPAPGGDPSLAWLLAVALAGVVVQVAMRPLRRILTLRHLRRPLWAETVDQRVSNLWQLALVGLRDLGWRPVPGEQPQEMARRAGLEGMGTCATVLERVRHGVRVDAGDLDAMEIAAESVYAAARSRAGWAARAAGWMRWPLV